MNDTELVTVTTDGSAVSNHTKLGGSGGWAAIMRRGDKIKEISGGEFPATNNEMELEAIIKAMSALKDKSKIDWYSDSQLVVKQASGEWKRKANLDRWAKFDSVLQEKAHKLVGNWVARNSTADLERCDELARQKANLYKRHYNR